MFHVGRVLARSFQVSTLGKDELVATVIVLNKPQMGSGDDELGRKILATCLRKLAPDSDLEAIVLYNGGVTLAARNSYVATEMQQLHDNGVDILPCGTCVHYYGLAEDLLFEGVSSMDEILATLRKADKVITL